MRLGRLRALLLFIGLVVLSIACGEADSKPDEQAVPDGGSVPAAADTEKLSNASLQFTVALVPVGVVDTVFVHDGKAFSRAADSSEIDVVFDLVNPAWIDVASGERMTYAEGMERWRVGRSELRGRLQELPGKSEQQAVEFLLDPEFSVEQKGDRVEFHNEFGTVTVDTIRPDDETWVSAFHLFNRLSSTWLFATDRGLPDTMIDATTPHLEELGLLPGRIASKPSPATGIAEHTIELEYRPLDAEVGVALDGFYETLQTQ